MVSCCKMQEQAGELTVLGQATGGRERAAVEDARPGK